MMTVVKGAEENYSHGAVDISVKKANVNLGGNRRTSTRLLGLVNLGSCGVGWCRETRWGYMRARKLLLSSRPPTLSLRGNLLRAMCIQGFSNVTSINLSVGWFIIQ